jgi:hypothetical protein
MEELDPLVLDCQDDAVGVLGDGINPVIAQLVLPECFNKCAKVTVGCVGLFRGAEVRLPAVERHYIARFLFLFSNLFAAPSSRIGCNQLRSFL